MYALIYDEHDLDNTKNYVLSLHDTREKAETALENRKSDLGRKVQDCNSRIVWVHEKIDVGDFISPGQYATWRPGEEVPQGEMYSDAD